ncbi:MAG: HNH endonuclease [Oscillospiraceae bacterium]|nr:HNH endonuclease [Oscillospiraceae bacterium]
MEVLAICELCGAEYLKKNGKSKYCSDACKKAARKETLAKWREENKDYQKNWREAHPEYAAEWVKNHRSYGRDRSRKIRGSKEHNRKCVVCGKEFSTYIQHKHTCCDKCKCSHKLKRIPKDQIVDTDITVKALYERDGGICYLCGKPCDFNDIDKERHAIGSNYPTVDHVIPVTRGGMHSWDNVKLAHLSCNSAKHDKVV